MFRRIAYPKIAVIKATKQATRITSALVGENFRSMAPTNLDKRRRDRRATLLVLVMGDSDAATPLHLPCLGSGTFTN